MRLAISHFEAGSFASSPFGATEAGLVDFRGLPVPKPLILRQLKLSGIDLSFASFPKLILIGCDCQSVNLDGASGALLLNASRLAHLSCSGARLADSGSVGGASCAGGSFKGCDLSGAVFKDTRFVECDFSDARLDDVDFGSSTIERSRFFGSIRKCFFRGSVVQCDFKDAKFIDSAFYGAEFVECIFSTETLHVTDLAHLIERMQDIEVAASLSTRGKKSLELWRSIFEELNPSIKHWLIDKRSLVDTDGREVGEELFQYFQQITH